jgi:hypothetical protein
MEQILLAKGWYWPYVSTRAEGIDQIDIWSSHGEVAKLGSSERMIRLLRQGERVVELCVDHSIPNLEDFVIERFLVRGKEHLGPFPEN